jgi:lysozyme
MKDLLDILKHHEGCVLNAYPDPATGGEPWTIGYGSTFYEDGSKVKKGDSISRERAEKLLEVVATNFMNKVKAAVKSNVKPCQLYALTSFAFNVGMGNLLKSTLLKKVNANPNDPTITQEFMKWNKAAGKVMNGLTKRRASEAQLYFKN